MEQLKLVSWNAQHMEMSNIDLFLKYCAQKEVDVIFLQNVSKQDAYSFQPSGPYKLASAQTVQADRVGEDAYAVFFNPNQVNVASKGYLMIPSQPANADAGQETRITANSFAQIQVSTLADHKNQQLQSEVKLELRIAQLNKNLCSSNEQVAEAMETAAIAGYTLFSLGSPPAVSESLAISNYEQAKKDLFQKIEISESNRQELEVTVKDRTNNYAQDQIQQLIEANDHNAEANYNELDDLMEQKKSLLLAEQTKSASDFQSLAVSMPSHRQSIEMLQLNTEYWSQKAQEDLSALPVSKQQVIEVFNWAAPLGPPMPDLPNYGKYAFRRTLPFFNNPDDGSVPTGTSVLVLGAFGIPTSEMVNENNMVFSNMINGKPNAQGEAKDHIVNFTPSKGKLVKDSDFVNSMFQGPESSPICANFQF